MLSFLRIKDFALIKSLEMELGPGLTVITGETGAGKSIILAALSLILGQRATSGLIRENSDSAVVEALFELSQPSPAGDLLEDPQEDRELVIKRVVNQQGRNRVQINGSLANLSRLTELAPFLVSICGQHAHQSLLSPEEHLYLLDAFANLEENRRQVEKGVAELKKLSNQIRKTQKDLADRELKRDFLNLQINELEAAGLDPAEEANLKAERSFLANAEKVMRLGSGADHTLYAADQDSVLENLSKVRDMLIDLARIDPRVKTMADTVEEAYYQLDDVGTELRDYLAGLSFDHGRLDWLESRLASLQRLVRKYGGDVESALKTLEQAKRELTGLEKGEDTLKELEGKYSRVLEQTLALAGDLSTGRKDSGRKLARAVEGELKELGMEHCRFEIRFKHPNANALETEKGPLSPSGLEEVHFYLAPNPGEGYRPLAQIASGGELSRILLALQALAAHKRSAGLQVFDEVDAGIGGAIGSAVGRKLASLSKDMQVICITHLPQIAAWGDRHFVVRKEVANGRTITNLIRLDQDKRIHELTRMLAGEGDGQAAREHARQMLSAAFEQKQNPRPVV